LRSADVTPGMAAEYDIALPVSQLSDLRKHQKSFLGSGPKQLKFGMNSHPINIYRATISIETRVGNMLIIGRHPQWRIQ
jgi:hypothetical protein